MNGHLLLGIVVLEDKLMKEIQFKDLKQEMSFLAIFIKINLMGQLVEIGMLFHKIQQMNNLFYLLNPLTECFLGLMQHWRLIIQMIVISLHKVLLIILKWLFMELVDKF